jgi:hypothetical protein
MSYKVIGVNKALMEKKAEGLRHVTDIWRWSLGDVRKFGEQTLELIWRTDFGDGDVSRKFGEAREAKGSLDRR